MICNNGVIISQGEKKKSVLMLIFSTVSQNNDTKNI